MSVIAHIRTTWLVAAADTWALQRGSCMTAFHWFSQTSCLAALFGPLPLLQVPRH